MTMREADTEQGRFGALFHGLSTRNVGERALAFASEQFWGGHPNTFRSFYAWSSLSLGFFMLAHEEAFLGRPYGLMRLAMPVWAWAALFVLHWALVSLILTRGAPKGWQFAVNFFGFAIWTAYVTFQDLSLGYFALNASMERVAVLYSVWAMLRTGMGRKASAE